MSNGEGLRVVLWVAGCSHACPGCHNPVTWDICGGLLFDEKAETELMSELEKDYIDGITLSGGDPLHPVNRPDVEVLVKKIKKQFPDKTIWLYTGYLWEDVKELELINSVDVLLDGKFIKSLFSPNLPWVGSSNQKVIDVAKSKEEGKIVLYK